MARNNKLIKFIFHVVYLFCVTYIVDQISDKSVSVRQMDRFLNDMKHILLWYKVHGIEDQGQLHVINRRCRFLNCYFTANRTLFGDLRYFDAIVFNLQDVSKGARDLPTDRTFNQRFIFAANDSADNYPVCDSKYDGFFNWTWTYKSDSIVNYRFVSASNIYGEKLGLNFPWITQAMMKPADSSLKLHLASKKNAVVTFLDQCTSRSKREKFIENLKLQLQKYNLTVDVYGDCGPKKCMRKTITPCYWLLRKWYYFYLALEDSFAEDYITDAVIHAYENNVVPIVYGGADYERYLPPGSYLSAQKDAVETIAEKIQLAMKNRNLYYEYFRWKRHYIMQKSPVLDACALCSQMNNPKMMVHKISYSSFRKWWNPEYKKRCSQQNKMLTL